MTRSPPPPPPPPTNSSVHRGGSSSALLLLTCPDCNCNRLSLLAIDHNHHAPPPPRLPISRRSGEASSTDEEEGDQSRGEESDRGQKWRPAMGRSTTATSSRGRRRRSSSTRTPASVRAALSSPSYLFNLQVGPMLASLLPWFSNRMVPNSNYFLFMFQIPRMPPIFLFIYYLYS